MTKHHNDDFDAKLATPAQEAMREVVRALPDETVNLAWRSALNEKVLLAAKAKRRQSRINWIMRPVAGLAIAGSMALFVVLQSPVSKPTAHVEVELLAAHEEATRFADVSGSGLTPIEVAYGASQNTSGSVDWTEVDLESL